MTEQPSYCSVLAPYMRQFLDIKTSAGIITRNTEWILKEFDDFANIEQLSNAHVTEEFFQKWRATRITDSERTLYAKCSVWSQLTRMMSRCGCDCFIPRMPKHPKQDFTPYIFTPEQITDIFNAADKCRLYDIRMGTALISIPVILRLLYSTGMRVSEVLSIKNRDVHMEDHYIHLRKTKNGSERIVPICKSMEDVLKQYIGYRDRMPIKGISVGDSFLFTKSDGTNLKVGTVYQNFRKLLDKCGIPHFGNNHGPRVHDIRHSHSVHALVQMGRMGMDLYTALPILSASLGHHSLMATEKYVRLTRNMYPELEKQCSEINAFVYPNHMQYP